MEFITGVNLFSTNLMVTIGVFVVAIIAVYFISRRLLWNKLENEIKLAGLVYDNLYKELHNTAWDVLTTKKQNQGLADEYHNLYEDIEACRLLIDEFKDDNLNGMTLKEANTALMFINTMMSTKEDAVKGFHRNCLEKANGNVGVQEKKTMRTRQALAIERPKVSEPIIEIKPDLKPNRNWEQQTLSPEQAGSVFPVGIKITGDVLAERGILLGGTIIGNVKTKETLEMVDEACVEGNVEADTLFLQNGFIHGNVSILKAIHVKENAYVKGNMRSESAYIEGKVEGDISTKEMVITHSAKIIGDVITETLEIEKGASFEGNITME